MENCLGTYYNYLVDTRQPFTVGAVVLQGIFRCVKLAVKRILA